MSLFVVTHSKVTVFISLQTIGVDHNVTIDGIMFVPFALTAYSWSPMEKSLMPLGWAVLNSK